MSNSGIIKSSIVKKYWMALTGLFLCLFLVGHLVGNLQLLIDPANGAKDIFNDYAYFMTHNPLIKIMSYLTYFSILVHAIDGIVLTIQNRKARPIKYAYNKPSANSKWASRQMALLGSLILAFIILHMNAFWAKMHWGDLEIYATAENPAVKDLYGLTMYAFNGPESLAHGIIYTIAMIVLGFHLSHGFQSAFQTLGLNHKKYTPIIKMKSTAFAIIVPLLFAIIPWFIKFEIFLF